MSPTQTPPMFAYKTPSIFLSSHPFRRSVRNSAKFRCVFGPTVSKLKVVSSLGAIFGSGNVIAAAAAAAGSGSHAAVASAITQVAVTAVAIASGACLSTKVDFLWPKAEELPGSLILDGVDVTGYHIFNDAKVQKAIAFARKAHHGQLRKTGDPYLTHCIHTGRILAVLVPSSGKRAIDTVVAGILHDVVDDTCESLHSVEEEFGDDVAKLVAGVSRLSYINQLLRRHRRINVNQGILGHEEANNLRVMLLGMVDDPRVVLIKLADRLHNMRTIYALPLPKAQAVAQETLLIWCSLASRLGLWALKAELEDLCFAVLQPQTFLQMRADLASMWSPSNRSGNSRRTAAKDSSPVPLNEKEIAFDYEGSLAVDADVTSMKDLLEAVLPFDILLDRRKRINFLNNLGKCSKTQKKPQVVRDAGLALASLVLCEEALERELLISTSYVPGMEVTLSSRLKSLYSIYSKMKRKDVGINKIYDARALRVVVGDKNGTLCGPAVQCCYNLLSIIHRLWTPIDGEFDDYIVNPKPSGYQSLHTAVQGPDNSPLEVQIRTQRMHEYAEHGLAAHWLYKETENKLPSTSILDDSEIKASSYFSEDMENQDSVGDDVFQKYGSLKAGHPVLRVEGSHLLAAVVVRVDKDGRELLVAVSFGLAASEAVADRRSSFQIKRWEAYARLYKKVSDEWWFEPGHGDWCTCLEKYTLCRDGMYHKEDQFQRLLPTFIQVIDLTEQEESEYWAVVSAIFEGKQIASIESHSNSSFYKRPSSNPISSTSLEANINNKELSSNGLVGTSLCMDGNHHSMQLTSLGGSEVQEMAGRRTEVQEVRTVGRANPAKSYVEAVRRTNWDGLNAIKMRVTREEIAGNLQKLEHCLVVSWKSEKEEEDDLERLGSLWANSWGLKGKLGLAKLERGKALLEFEDLSEARRVASSGSRLLGGAHLGLELWNPKTGCRVEEEMEQIAWVRIYGLPISLWSPGTLKKIGEECGGFVDMDERTRSMGEIQWARILVKTKGDFRPSLLEIEVEDEIYSVALWWEIRPVVKRPFSATENRRNKEVRGELHSRAEKRVGKELVGAGIEELQTPVDGSDLQENGPGPAPGLQFQGQENRDWASPIGRMVGPAASGPNMGLSGLKKDGGLNKMDGLLGRKLKNKPKVNDYSEAGPSWVAEMGCNQLTEVEGPEREGPIAPLEKAGFLGRFSSRKGPNSEDPLISWVIEEPRREQGDVGLSMTDRAVEEEVKRYALNPYPKGKRAVGTPLLLFSNSDRAPEGESFDHPGGIEEELRGDMSTWLTIYEGNVENKNGFWKLGEDSKNRDKAKDKEGNNGGSASQDTENEKEDPWEECSLAKFSQFLGFSTEGLEKEILSFLIKIRKRREKIHSKELLEKSKFERELKRLECSVNYEGGNRQKGPSQGKGNQLIVAQ